VILIKIRNLKATFLFLFFLEGIYFCRANNGERLETYFRVFLKMPNKMKKLLFVLFSVLCCTCENNNRIFDVDTQLNLKAHESIELKGEKLPIEAFGGYGIKVFDTLLVITTDSPDHFRDVYGLKSYSLLAKIFKKGRARNEFLFVGYGGQYKEENGSINLYIHDLNKNAFWKYNLIESIKQNVDSGEIICKLPMNYQGAYYLSPDIFCYRDIVPGKGCSYVVKNIKEDKIIEEFSVVNFMKMDRNTDIPISNYMTKDNSVIVCYSRKIDQLMFIDVNKGTKISVSTSNEQPTWSRLKAEYEDVSRLYYDYIATTEQEIYALYKGNPAHLEIHCFSQTGDFLKKMIVKEKMMAFDVAGAFIFGLTTDEEIFKYKM